MEDVIGSVLFFQEFHCYFSIRHDDKKQNVSKKSSIKLSTLYSIENKIWHRTNSTKNEQIKHLQADGMTPFKSARSVWRFLNKNHCVFSYNQNHK